VKFFSAFVVMMAHQETGQIKKKRRKGEHGTEIPWHPKGMKRERNNPTLYKSSSSL
jgi:hypothetical protein